MGASLSVHARGTRPATASRYICCHALLTHHPVFLLWVWSLDGHIITQLREEDLCTLFCCPLQCPEAAPGGGWTEKVFAVVGSSLQVIMIRADVPLVETCAVARALHLKMHRDTNIGISFRVRGPAASDLRFNLSP